MPIDVKMENVEDDDPNRCQATAGNKQCQYKALKDNKFCYLHCGAGYAKNKEDKKVRNYRLSKWQGRLDELADNSKIKSLREEIGILRILLEETMSRCETPTDLLLVSNKISDLAIKIEKVVASCHRLETSTGMMLDKSAALHLAATVVEIIGRYIPKEEIVDQIAVDIMKTVIEGKKE